MDVSRITRGMIALHKQRNDLRDLVQHALETVRPLIEARHHTLTVELPSLPVWVDADEIRLTQVVTNLLNNAAKYTDEGGQIVLRLETSAAEAVLRVRDTGIGIAPDLLPFVFDLFTQAERGADRSQGGLGIGLTLVRRLVELHNGRIEAFSAGLGHGSEFVVHLPLMMPPRIGASTP
jgi:signal transduction histidine kinase